MKQLLQNLKTGELEISEVPVPALRSGQLLIQSRVTLISAGTEKMLVSFAKSGFIGKARQQPEKVKQVIDKIQADGLLPTLHSVFSRLDEPLPLGYCNCGTVLEVGAGVTEFKPGDRVVNNGPHADVVCVPKNLCAKVPDGVSDEQAAFTVLGSIGLQGIRLLNPTLGETIVVFGLGLIGLMTVQLLKANGCNVIGIDLDDSKVELARKFGAHAINPRTGVDPVEAVKALTNGQGADGVLITASAKQDSITKQSAQMSRKKGRIILVGVVDLNLDRSDFYEKEISFQVSCSYGPGRYDDTYEKKGQDYPLGFVRWTEQRNFEAILDCLANQSLCLDELIADRIPIEQAKRAYDMLTDDPSKLAMILTYPNEQPKLESSMKTPAHLVSSPEMKDVVLGVVGAGNFSKLTLLPAIKPLQARLRTVVDPKGAAGGYVAGKFGFETSSNQYQDILDDPEINTVIITTRHDSHASMVIDALKANKHVAVEKPLCLNQEELDSVIQAYKDAGDRHLFVGFNRRFSPHAEKMQTLLSSRSQPMSMQVMVNAGHIPANVWVQNDHVGGGRIIGEGCHWLDLMVYLTGHPITSVVATRIGESPAVEIRDDKMTITCTFADGSIGTLHYFANGDKLYPKESMDVFCGGKILQLNNFRKLKGYGWPNFKKMNLFSQDKGHRNEFKQFFSRISEGGEPVIPFDQIINVTQASFAAVESAHQSKLITL